MRTNKFVSQCEGNAAAAPMPLLGSPAAIADLRSHSATFKSLSLNSRQLCDLEMLLNGALHPLEGYLCQKAYASVLERMRLLDGTFWPLPICLGVDESFAQNLSVGEQVALRDAEGYMLAVITVDDVWQPDLEREVALISELGVPSGVGNVAHCESATPWYVGGAVTGIALPQRYDFIELRRPPAQMRSMLSDLGWERTIAVQVGRPLHKADLGMLTDIAREVGAGIVLFPVTVPSPYYSVDHFMLVRCIKAFADHFPSGNAVVCLTPWFERHIGPRGALLRGVVNSQYGCTHMLVWDEGKSAPRHNALSDAYQAHVRWLTDMGPHMHIEPLRERCIALDSETGTYVPSACGRRSSADHGFLVDLLRKGEAVPDMLSFPEVVGVMKKTYRPRFEQGLTLFFTGLSGAGKSTLAKALYVELLERGDRPVTLLDGDVVRTNLSCELDFSEAHRNLNVQRIGFVASEIVKNGGVAICAPIAPYAQSRRQVREQCEQYGGFIEIYVNTSLAVCEQRDRKGLYAKARAGLIKGVTGVDAPYVPPVRPELILDTSALTPRDSVACILRYLVDNDYIRS